MTYISRMVRKVILSWRNNGLRFTIKQIVNYLKHQMEVLCFKRLYQLFSKIRISSSEIKYSLINFRYRLPNFSGLNKQKRDKKIIVSLTSFPPRINAVTIVLGILLRQTCKPDRILLYLAKDQFANRKLPLWLKLQEKCGVEVVYCDDLKSHKKYYYAMQKYPNDIVITVDDDLYYERDLVERLYESYEKHPKAISAARTHLITFDKYGKISPYNEWKWEYSQIIDQPSTLLIATGVGGVLYPPHCMHSEVFNKERITSLCLTADDLWLKIMQIMNNTPVVLGMEIQEPNCIKGTQESALFHENVTKNRNDQQLQSILKVYNEYFGKDDTLIRRMKEDI